MKLPFPLVTLTLSYLTFTVQITGSSDVLQHNGRLQARDAGDIQTSNKKRMLSAGLKAQGTPKYAGKVLDKTAVEAIRKSAKDVAEIINKNPGALVLALGNSPAYTLAAFSSSDLASLNIYEAPMSGGLPPMIPETMAQNYASKVLVPIIKEAKEFKSVILLDIYGTGASKEEYKTLLIACEPYLKSVPKGVLAQVKQIAIIDAGQTPPKGNAQVPIVGVVVMDVKDLARDLTDGLYPRLVANYPSSMFTQVATTDQIDAKGRIEVLRAIQGM